MHLRWQAKRSGWKSDGKSPKDSRLVGRENPTSMRNTQMTTQNLWSPWKGSLYSLLNISFPQPSCQPRNWKYTFQEGFGHRKSRYYLSIPDMDTLVKGPAGQIFPIRAERHTVDRLLMLGQCVDANASLHIPQSNRRIKWSTRKTTGKTTTETGWVFKLFMMYLMWTAY